MATSYKPVGGVESCTLYPADAVVTALFSSEGCEVELSGTPMEVELLEDKSNYEEMIYEGYGPHGIAVLVETATDNTNRTVASVRMYFNKYGGTLGTSGSVGFMFEHKCVFKFKPTAGADLEEMELEMIDFGVDEFYAEEGEVTVYAAYESFGQIQTWIEEKGYELVSGESVRIPTDTKELTSEEREAVNKLIEHLEEDDDVTNVYTTMAESEEDEAEE